MKESDGIQSRKQKGKLKKRKPSLKSFPKDSWSNVTISRNVDNIVYKVTESMETNDLSFLKEQSKKLQIEEENIDKNVKHLYCENNGKNFMEDQSPSPMTSSMKFGEHLELETSGNSKEILRYVEESVGDNRFVSLKEKWKIREKIGQDKPIFVDLTADEKNSLKETIPKHSSDENTCQINGKEIEDIECHLNVSEHRIMIADNANKMISNGNGSLATALRDRGSFSIPIQPNPSLPIRPAPSVPTRSFRKESAPFIVASKSSALEIVEEESIKSADRSSCKKADINSIEETLSKDSKTLEDTILPQISIVKNFNEMNKRDNNEMDKTKENKKKKKSYEIDFSSSENKNVENSNKEHLASSDDSNATRKMIKVYSDKSGKILPINKKKNTDKMVPPLRLKKIVHIEKKRRYKSQKVSKTAAKPNYRIVKDTTHKLQSEHQTFTNINDPLNENETDYESFNTDSYKLKCRRNRLKCKLRELRGKAVDLANEMANDTDSQKNTRLTQIMNRYQKQIENLSKLHSKLSADLSIPKEIIDVDDDNVKSPIELSCSNLNKKNVESVDNDSSILSPEPPKLSPRSPLNYDNVTQEEIRNSPPILHKICLTISSNENYHEENEPIMVERIWDFNKETLNEIYPTKSLKSDSISSVFENSAETVNSEQANNIDSNIKNNDLDTKENSFKQSDEIVQFSEDTFTAENGEMQNLSEKLRDCDATIRKSDKIGCLEISESGPVINSIIGKSEVTTTGQEDETFEIPSKREIHSTSKCILQSNSYEHENIPLLKVDSENDDAQKIATNPSQKEHYNNLNTITSQENLSIPHNYKKEFTSNDSEQQNTENHSLTEQFPTLGNWFARMSKKQGPRTKSRLQNTGNVSWPQNETAIRFSEQDIPKNTNSTTLNDGTNVTSQCNTESWQYHYPQQQRQQLPQHAGLSSASSQPIAAVPPLRPGICPPVSMPQYYSNFPVDPYGSTTLTYHPTICPYGTYPYHTRLHSSSLSGYHIGTQDSLRSVQPMDKRLPFVQEPTITYPLSVTNSLHHPSNLEFNRLQGNSSSNGANTNTCLASLFLPPPTLTPSPQTLTRSPLIGYSTNSQFSRNRMMPDVVAVAAAAAVVAAASLDRQHDTLSYNRTDSDTLSTTGIGNVIDVESPQITNSSKPVVLHHEINNEAVSTHLNGETHDNSRYQQMHNFLYDRLGLVRTTNSYVQSNSVTGSNASVSIPPIITSTSYQMPMISHIQLAKNVKKGDLRSCETPHLGKMNRSPNTLHNYTCSNCGIIGPKFKCLGCEMAFYCNEQCQEKHWCIHVQKCPKKMPKLKKVS